MNSKNSKNLGIVIGLVLLLGLGTFVTGAYANNSWGGYHWGRTQNPFTLELGDNVSSKWDTYLGITASDWSLSSVLDTVVAAGGTKPRNCKASEGRVEACSAKYGFTGWLGLAQIWISGGHITKGVMKVNDTYFNTLTYDTPEWRNLVMCQEIGHTLGLAHQDENFDNEPLGTCMDYSSDPTFGQHPNQHDYDMLDSIYAHLDSVNTVGPPPDDDNDNDKPGNGKGRSKKDKPAGVGTDVDLNDPSAWGRAVSKDARGNTSLYARELGNGEKLFTFVIWID